MGRASTDTYMRFSVDKLGARDGKHRANLAAPVSRMLLKDRSSVCKARGRWHKPAAMCSAAASVSVPTGPSEQDTALPLALTSGRLRTCVQV